MYKCLECGHIFEDGEEVSWSESRGEYWGDLCYEEYSGCPLCRGGYEETMPCSICGAELLDEQLYGGVCAECMSKYKNNIDMCYKVGASDKDTVEINCFLSAQFTESEIEEILLRELKAAQSLKGISFEDFIYDDGEWFGERLAEEVKKNEDAKNKQSRS